MRIRRAVSGNQLNQGFGEANTPPSLLPTYQALGFKGHCGWDWGVHCEDYTVEHGGKCSPAYYDMDIDAVVIGLQQSDQYGFGITARSQDQDGIFEHLWWHFDLIDPNLTLGSVLKRGMPLGITGRTGKATGDHLHRELRPLTKDTNGNYYKTYISNGYGGAIDLTPYFINEFVLDSMHIFNVNMYYSQTSTEVLALQKCLIDRGYNTLQTAYYGEMTRKAVLKFQQDNNIGSPLEILMLQGKVVGPKTRAVLNSL